MSEAPPPPEPQAQPDDRLDGLARGALTAAVAVARELGLDVGQPTVLANDQNLLVHLSPSPVVARVATRIAWSRPDPAAWLAREVAVASHAARNGGPVVPPTDLVEPGPHTRDGHALTLWTYVDADEGLASEFEVGEALGQLHLSLRDFPRSALPDRLPVHAQIENGLAALTRDRVVDGGTLERLAAMHRQLSLELDPVKGTEGVIHGDAHPWNLLHIQAGWRWIDMEETGFGPQEFDLAVLASKVDDPKAALASYASTVGTAVVPQEMLAQFQRIRELETVVWGLGMAVTDPSFRDTAEDRLRRLLEQPPEPGSSPRCGVAS
jgi:Ser/Thr protein kinase RdoA (MazF antagonist)